MDRTSITVLVVCFVLLFSLPVLVNKVFPPKPVPPGATNVATRVITNTGAQTATGTSRPQPVLETPALPRQAFDTNVPEQLLEFTNANAHYTFSSRGGGLKVVELLHYLETVSNRRDRRPSTRRVATLNS